MSFSDSLARQFEQETGIQVEHDWILSILSSFSAPSSPSNAIRDIYKYFLESDINLIGVGCFPAGVKEMRTGHLQGSFIAQADEIVNIAAPIKQRYKAAGKGRCLKLSLTDGVQVIQAVEAKLVTALDALMPAGIKIAIRDAEVRQGLVMLHPGNVLVLGGKVARLEEARQKMLQKWAEPSDGRQENLLQQMTQASWRQLDGPLSNPSSVQPTSTIHPLQASSAATHSLPGPQPPHLASPWTQPSSRDQAIRTSVHIVPNLETSGLAHGAALVTPASHQPARNVLSDSPGQAPPSSIRNIAPPAYSTIPAQGRLNHSPDHATTPMQSIQPASGTSCPPFQAFRVAGNQRGVLAGVDDEPSFSQPRMSQTVDRPAVPGFSRGAVRQMGGDHSRRPSLLGQQQLVQPVLASNRHLDSRTTPAIPIQPPTAPAPPPDSDEACAEQGDKTPSSLSSPDPLLDMALSSSPVADAVPEHYSDEEDVEGGVIVYNDIVPETEVQEDIALQAWHCSDDFNGRLNHQSPDSRLPSPHQGSAWEQRSNMSGHCLHSPSRRSLADSGKSEERVKEVSSGQIHSHERKRPRLESIKEGQVVDLVFERHQEHERLVESRGSSLRRICKSSSPTPPHLPDAIEKAGEGPGVEEQAQDQRNFLYSPGEIENQGPGKTKRQQGGRRAFCMDSSPEPSPSPDQPGDNWHSASEHAYSPDSPPPLQNGQGSEEPLEKKEPGRGTSKAMHLSNRGTDAHCQAGPPVLEDTARTRSVSEDWLAPMTLAQCKQRIQDTDPEDLPLECLVAARISRGSRLTIKASGTGPQFYMQVTLADDDTVLEAAVSHHLIQHYVGCTPEEVQQMSEKGGTPVFSNLSQQVAGFQGYVQLFQFAGQEFCVITNLNRDDKAFR